MMLKPLPQKALFTTLALLTFLLNTEAQNVGIGTQLPFEKLHVDGTIRSDDLAGTGNAYLVLDADGNLAFRINHNGQTNFVLTGAGTLVNINTILPTDIFVSNVIVTPPTLPATDYLIQLDRNGSTPLNFSIDVADNDDDAANELNTSATLNGTVLEIVDAGGTLSIDLSTLQDADSDPTNEFQTISSSTTGPNVTITISDGNSTTFSIADNDTNPNNELNVNAILNGLSLIHI